MQYLYERVRSEDGTERYAAQYFVKRSLSPEMKAELKKFDSRLLWCHVMSSCTWLLLLLVGIFTSVLGADRLLTYLFGLLFFGFLFFIQPIFRKLFFPEKKENELLARCREEMNVPPDAEKME